MNGRIAFFPYSPNGVDYIVKIQCILQRSFDVIDYMYLRNGIVDISDIKLLYLNWIEDVLTIDDKEILKEAKASHVRIVWVFHNKHTHDCVDSDISVNNIRFITEIADVIMLHSKGSGKELAKICACDHDVIKDKLRYIPHLNYIGDYRSFTYPNKNPIRLTDDNRFTYAFVGAIRPYKNVEVLIDAYKRISDQTDSMLIVAGKPESDEYVKTLREKSDDANIVIYPYYIGSLELAGLLDRTDMLVFPYDLSSSMNSGSIIMAFSYGKTVIVPDICMADDFPDNLIFKYHYETKQEHIEMLYRKMADAYRLGKPEIKRKGSELRDIVMNENNEEIVERLLMGICLDNEQDD